MYLGKEADGHIGAFSAVLFTYCMDCKKYLGSKDGKRIFSNSHGLCETCLTNRINKNK